jgi:hypothetical protein
MLYNMQYSNLADVHEHEERNRVDQEHVPRLVRGGWHANLPICESPAA